MAEFSFNYIFYGKPHYVCTFAIVAITQFNLEINAKFKPQDSIDLKSKENKNDLLL